MTQSRTSRTPACIALPLMLALAGTARAQQLIGYVNTRDADITGASDVLDGQAVLTGSVSVTAKDHTAPITLGRGGTVRVCQTSVLHVTEGHAVTVASPLLFSLDRGAVEIQMNGTPTDAIMTPDMRFTVRTAGPLDLRLRVARNGDTCVENRGPVAPTLAVSDPFGEAMYEVGPGQHILFEHGSLHEVVDHETSPCGCPENKGMSIADALLASGGPKPAAPAPDPSPATMPAPVAVQAPPPAVVATTPPPAVAPAPVPTPASIQTPAQISPSVVLQPLAPAPASVPAKAPPVQPAPAQASDLAAMQAAEQAAEQAAAQSAIRAAERAATQSAAQAAERHPFPDAISEGLAPPAEAPPPAPGRPRAQVTDTLSYNAPVPAPVPAPAAPTPAAKSRTKNAPASKASIAAAPAKAAAPPPPPPPHDLAHFFGNFFRKLFGRG